MTAAVLLDVGQPLFERLFPPMAPMQQVQNTPMLISAVLTCCLAAVYLVLWGAAPDFRAFRSLGIFFAVVGVNTSIGYFGGQTLYWSIRALASAALVATAGEAMQIPHRRWTWLFWPIYLFAGVAVWFPALSYTNELAVYTSQIPLAILIFQGLRRSSARDRLIAAAFLFYWFVRLTLTDYFRNWTGIGKNASTGGWKWPYTTTTVALLGVVTLAILVRDLIRDRGEKQRMAAELEASHAIQQVLIAQAVPAVPGFTIESAYKPAGEVGGDFFQVIAPRGDGVLLAIGDVSGKGMPAAMTVSQLVGSFRTLAQFTQSPGEILVAMNQGMLGRSAGGFTTCLVVCVKKDGTLTVSNAGHLSPYHNGRELPCESGLPLGILPESAYTETQAVLNPGDTLTFLSDGVLEARNPSGELFGFDRTAAISTQSAEAIATAAQRFGQEDDITVLTLTFAPIMSPAEQVMHA